MSAKVHSGLYSWHMFRWEIGVLKDQNGRMILHSRAGGAYQDEEMFRFYVDSRCKDPLIRVRRPKQSSLNPPYPIESLQSGDVLGHIQRIALEPPGHYRLSFEADEIRVEYRQGKTRTFYIATAEQENLATFCHHGGLFGKDTATTTIPSESQSFVMIMAGWEFIRHKESNDFLLSGGQRPD
jgi:hypothetical protein